MDRRKRRFVPTLAALAVVTLWLCGAVGCSWLGHDKVDQVQADNERLIRDFRSERERAEQYAIQNRALLSRISELETRLATISDAVENSGNVASQRREAPFRPVSQSPLSQSPIQDDWQPSP